MTESSEVTQIVSPDRFWWNILPESETLFNQKAVVYDYRADTLNFMEPNLPNMIKVRSFIYLDIYLGNSQLLDAGIITDYDVHVDTFDNIKDELMRIGNDAHERFVVIFNQYNRLQYISPTFRPTLDHEALEQKIQQLLHDGVCY